MFKQIASLALVAAVSSAVTLSAESETDLDQRGRGRGRASSGTRGAPKGRWGQGSIQAGYEKYDANGDGQLNRAERYAAREGYLASLKAKRSAKRDDFVAKYDTNDDGKID